MYKVACLLITFKKRENLLNSGNCVSSSAQFNDVCRPAGLPALLEEVSRMHTEHDGVEVIPSQVVVAPGSKELIFLTMKLFDGGVVVLKDYF